jgi:hypothetical protein
MQKPVAIVSYFSMGAYDTNTVDEDKILSGILSELDIPNEIIPWSAPDEDWSRFSTLLIKSVWDYFDFYPEFLKWINHVESLNITVLNGLKQILWNSSKTYLLEIQAEGFPVIAGILLEKGSKFDGKNLSETLGSDIWVVKPLVSGGAKNTIKIHAAEWESQQEKINELLQTESYLIQPFIKEVAETGEYSLLFFNGKFSHAVLKTPAPNDFRVQHYYGGTIATLSPTAAMLASCQALVDEFASDSLYVRVDGVEISGVFHLMELEMIEPYLFLALDEKAIPNYKKALEERLK